MAKVPHSLRARLALAAAGLGVALVLAEVGLRYMGPLGPEFILDGATSFYDPSLFVDDPVVLKRLAPNAQGTIRTVEGTTQVRTNALGMRGGQVGTKQQGTQRVLALGDSFTLGLQVLENETWAAQLSEGLTARLEHPVEVWNAGVSGYGTEQSTIRLRQLARRIGADAAVLLVYLGNDFRDNVRYPERLRQLANPPPIPPTPPSPPVLRHYLRNLARWSRIAAYGVMWAHTSAASQDPSLKEYRDEILPFVDAERLAELLPATTRALHGFGTACTQLGLPCIVALAPPAYAVHTERLERTLEAFGFTVADSDLEAPARAITGQRLPGLTVIDLTTALRNSHNSPLYLTFDPHWSAEGHAVAARQLIAPVAGVLKRAEGSP